MRKGKKGRPQIRPEVNKTIEELDKKGYSITEIAKIVAMPRTTVQYRVKRLSTPLEK